MKPLLIIKLRGIKLDNLQKSADSHTKLNERALKSTEFVRRSTRDANHMYRYNLRHANVVDLNMRRERGKVKSL